MNKMKHLYIQTLLVLTALFCSLGASARPITRQQAQLQALQFLHQRGDSRMLSPVVNARKLAPVRNGRTQSAGEPYYVFDRGMSEGFIIVSGDDQTIPVLGYTDEGTFDYEQLPPNLQDLLDDYAQQLSAIQAGAPVLKLPANHPKVDQMITSKWSQGSPYNDACPLDAGRRSVTGCVATAMAQLLYYNREKSVTETTAEIPGYSTWTKGISVSSVPAGSPIDWANMKDTYGSATDKQKKAVADLMLYCGVAAKMDYTNSSSGAQSSDAYEAFAKYFGYGKSVKFVTYADVSSDDDWDRIVYAEMAAGRPIYVSGSNATVGHAFVADGYENQRFHINWGWGGQSDGYYYLTNLTPGDGQGIGGSDDGYNGWKQIIIGIEPENFGEKAMTISDATAKKICVAKWDANGDGKLTYNEAAAIEDLGDAFKGNTTIKKFPELYYFTSLTSLADDAFNGCTQLTTLRLPKALKTIGKRALKDCKKLTQIILPTGINAIGEEAFAGCSVLGSFELSNELTTIENGTFKNCAAITEIDLPISISRIGDEAFAGCTKLSSFTVNTYHPADIVMGTSVFGGTDLSKAKLHVMQGTKAFFANADQWKEFGSIIQTRDISGGLFTALETGKTYYLYNVGTGRYLTKGEAYNTQAVVGTTAMRFKAVHSASKPEGIFYFSSPDTGNDGKYLFRTMTDGNVGKGVKACFVDGKSLTASTYWNVQLVGDNIYTIQIPSTDNTYVEGQYLGIQTDHESGASSPTYGAYSDVDYATHKLNCQWQFVLYDEQAAERNAEAATLEKLLSTAKKQNVKYEEEQAVYDDLESTAEAILAAQSSLRKKLGLIEFYHKEVREQCISYFDSDTDGELSYKEASEVSDFGWLFNFMNITSLVHVDELQYFSNATALHGNFMQGCTNLESVVLPEGLQYIYYHAFYGCEKLKAVNIPEYVGTIGENAFYGCSSLREVTILNPTPSSINMGANIFMGVPVAECTLYVPYGSKEQYEAAPVWKDFGKIVEVRSHVQPKFSPFSNDGTKGYLYNIGTRKMITMGEAYGTQSIIDRKGRLYELGYTVNATTGDTLVRLIDAKSGNIIFRTSTDTKVGSGVKACFGDGDANAKGLWKFSEVAPNIYTLQVPKNDASYVEDEYLGIDESHQSDAASPTYGIYWDVKGIGPQTQWTFVTDEDMQAASEMNDLTDQLKKMLSLAKTQQIDVTEEQAVYDNPQSPADEMQNALLSVRNKLHFITFADNRARSICITNYDTNADGELTYEEAAQVTSIGETFRTSSVKYFEELKYFTALTEIPSNAFRGCQSLQALYLPANVRSLGSSAFMSCNSLRYVVMPQGNELVTNNLSGISSSVTLFVPAALQEAYQTDESWTSSPTVSVYTGIPVVTPNEASRSYGRSASVLTYHVDGAPIEGEPEMFCEVLNELATPVGQYPIEARQGTVVTKNVQYQSGIFNITPATLKVTANSYTRNLGEPNPTFELSIRGYRNHENDSVLIQRPVAICEATADSPAGIYEIRVEGGEAQNYIFNYISGELTIVDPVGIDEIADRRTITRQAYDLQGRPVKGNTRNGIRIVEGKKKVTGTRK